MWPALIFIVECFDNGLRAFRALSTLLSINEKYSNQPGFFAIFQRRKMREICEYLTAAWLGVCEK